MLLYNFAKKGRESRGKMNARDFGELSRNKRNDRKVRLRENWNRLTR